MNFRLKKLIKDYNCIIICVVMVIIASIAIPGFISRMNLINILIETSIMGIMAIGMTFLLLIGLFDLSIGHQISLVSLIIALTINWGVFPAIIISILASASVGFINSLLNVKLKINALIVTFAMMGILKGVNLLISQGQSTFIDNEIFTGIFNIKIFFVPIVIFIFSMMILLAQLFLKYTKTGFEIYVVGGNKEAAKLAGINSSVIIVFAFLVSSISIAISSILLTSRVATSSPTIGENYMLLVITACIIGGVRFTGGYGNVINTLFGVLTLQLVNNLMYMTNTYGYIQNLINGMILLAVLSIDKVVSISKNNLNES